MGKRLSAKERNNRMEETLMMAREILKRREKIKTMGDQLEQDRARLHQLESLYKPSQIEFRMEDIEFRELLNLLMVSDPEPTPLESLKALADREAKLRGFDSWSVALHEWPYMSEGKHTGGGDDPSKE